MRQREDQVMMRASEQPRLLKFQPALNLDLITLGTTAVFTGVLPHPLHMPLRTGLNMTA
jgi:hypothetical protein